MPLNDDNSHKYALNDEPICPHCDSKIKIEEYELWDLLDENGPHEIECPFCDKEIRIHSSATWTFDTSEQEDVEDETEVERPVQSEVRLPKPCQFKHYGDEKKCLCGYIIPRTNNDMRALRETIVGTGEAPKCWEVKP